MPVIHLITKDSVLEERVRETLEYYDFAIKYTRDDFKKADRAEITRANEAYRQKNIPPLIPVVVTPDFPLEGRPRDSVDLLIVDQEADPEHRLLTIIHGDDVWDDLPMILLGGPYQNDLIYYGRGYDMCLLRDYNPFELREFIRRLLTYQEGDFASIQL